VKSVSVRNLLGGFSVTAQYTGPVYDSWVFAPARSLGGGQASVWSQQELGNATLCSLAGATVWTHLPKIIHHQGTTIHIYSLGKGHSHPSILEDMLVTSDETSAGLKLAEMRSPELESLILVIMTGGTICMKRSPDGLIPERGFLENAMAPRQEFNDGVDHHPTDVRTNDEDPPKKLRTLRTPLSAYGKRIR
jgi:hypothetical protein